MSRKTPALVTEDPWGTLRRFTDARIALGRSGVSLPTHPHLAFQLAHAQARDAVHLPLDVDAVAQGLAALGYPAIRLHSAARDRREYLQRPDLGRVLDAASAQALSARRPDPAAGVDLAIVIADGLSATAVHHHAVALLHTLIPALADTGWSLAPIAIVEQGRVAVGDPVAVALGARMVAVLIGERPGLSSPDSLGVYVTYAPRRGSTDAERNCISNIRTAGLSYDAATHTLMYLLREAMRRRISGVRLKDETATAQRIVSRGSFLTDD
ncbi:ethanolamine ammonia-lyase subunit EutC [Denitromonas iodatirespirans]|uniref:Ethanolamine ammonia-lyase small subunit n=1 Tax=Denitromonas iodatirespirans TaxID=2795389 RepID=A0A944H6S8_DENI1|nr:ethanolamine ammonia-lyase subunit EutC [Denitromonas iodatirespirans]MBT0959590.1 ethanolamine ammonia-lyase subunit EutC [Denitromonas iodatirespirans]